MLKLNRNLFLLTALVSNDRKIKWKQRKVIQDTVRVIGDADSRTSQCNSSKRSVIDILMRIEV